MSDPKKAPIDLVPLRATVGAARVFAHGNTKKDRVAGDFVKREMNGEFFASTMRHLMELQALGGAVTLESLAHRDADTDLPTIDHVICNLMIIRTLMIRDGLLPIDPGPGRGRVTMEEAASFHMGSPPGDAPDLGELTDEPTAPFMAATAPSLVRAKLAGDGGQSDGVPDSPDKPEPNTVAVKLEATETKKVCRCAQCVVKLFPTRRKVAL